MAGRHGQAQRLAVDRRGGQATKGAGTEANAGIELAAQHAFHDRCRHSLAQMKLHLGMFVEEAPRQPGHAAVGRVHHETHGQVAQRALVGQARVPAGALQGNEHRLAILQELRAGLGQLRLARMTVEELNTQFLLQGAHLPAQRRLRDVQPLGGTPEMQRLRDGSEIADLTNVDHVTESVSIMTRDGIGMHQSSALDKTLAFEGVQRCFPCWAWSSRSLL